MGRPPAPGWRPPGPFPRPRPTGPGGPALLRSGEEELIAGRRPVEEAFLARRTAHRLLIVPQRRQALERIVLHATSLRIPVVEVEGGTLTAVAGFDGHQGVALVVAPRRFADLDEILARALERHEPPLVVVLDSLEDPQNVGTLLRSAEAAGAHGVIFPERRQAPLSPAAIKASAGATEHLLLAPVGDLAGALADLHVRGLRVVAAEADAPLAARQADLRGPLAIVIGSEGRGLSPAVRRRCDLAVRIPLRGRIASLNAAVAGSVLLFEAVSQRDGMAEPMSTAPGGTDPATDSQGAPGKNPAEGTLDLPSRPTEPQVLEGMSGAIADGASSGAARPDAADLDPDLLPGEPASEPADPAGGPGAPGPVHDVHA